MSAASRRAIAACLPAAIMLAGNGGLDMRARNHLLVIAALMGASAPTAAQPPQAPAPQELLPFVPRQVSPEVRLIATPPDYFGPAIGNIVVIEQSDGLVVVD